MGSIEYFECNPIRDDPLHIRLQERAACLKELEGLRGQLLGCCCPVLIDDEGTVKLIVDDHIKFEGLNRKQITLVNKIRQIEEFCAELDTIFEELNGKGPYEYAKSPKGLEQCLVSLRNAWHQQEDKSELNKLSKPVEDAFARAQAAWAETFG